MRIAVLTHADRIVGGAEIYLDTVLGRLVKRGHETDQSIDIVVAARDVMAAAKIHPFHLPDIFPELGFDGLERAFERVRIEFAQRMKMQALDPIEGVAFELR